MAALAIAIVVLVAVLWGAGEPAPNPALCGCWEDK